MVVIMLGWALSQVSLANFVQVFISKAKSATVVGYVMTIFLTLVGEALAVSVFAVPLNMPICTLFLIKTSVCIRECRCVACSIGWRSLAPTAAAFSSWARLMGEIVSCILVLYGSIILFPLSIYLHEVVQQEYGVKKTPLYFLG